MSNYLIELSVIHTSLVLGYYLFLRKERQYAKIRFFLIASTLLALAIPLLKLPKLLLFNNEPVGSVPVEAIPMDAMKVSLDTDASIWNVELLIWLYFAVSVFFLFKFFSSVFYLLYLERRSSKEKFNNLIIRKVRNIKGSFTFFNWIFLSDEIDKNDYEIILKHEKAHASLMHTYDLIFFDIFKVCFWFLPTAWFINREIKKIHEYQADAYAIKSCNVDHYSYTLISYALKTNGLSLANSFHHGLILKRLTAMKQQAKNVSPWKLGALSALCALLFVAFACSEEPKTDGAGWGASSSYQKADGDVFIAVETQPEFEGGIDAFHRYIMNEIRYPLQARQMGIEGRVDVQFVVGKDGSLLDVRAIKGIGAGCDEEAVRVLKNAPSFKPATQNGKPVFVRMVVPIVFSLNKGKTNKDNSAQGIIIIEKVESRNDRLNVDATYANGEWSGTVRDQEGEKLTGANIVIGGTSTGTSSDLEGTFKIKADQSQNIYVSFIGYETVKIEGKK